MPQKRVRIPRSKVRPRPQLVIEDSRTQRKRTRGDALREELDQADQELLEILREVTE